ncbi:PorV/PorQ family protein [Myroides pelagicus]|uniref:PorV/PorQ family protein n=1 Tax=Myroides pelagicus TaxID=270914 RepID=A0A7K1GQ03_9FLAO|nr:hypothetical protein [Myroides pelagicus]MEC4113378.1 hypothetical protein [Myroides pelagicus]MTH30284.1 hypothetical protein [Myroides pelagicus]
MNKGIVKTIVLLFLSVITHAQNRPIALIEAPVSPVSMSMGQVSMSRAAEGYVFLNPSAMLASGKHISADYNIGFLPTDESTMTLHTASVAYRYKNSAFFIGGRYFDMGSIDGFGQGEFNEGARKIDLQANTVNIGYAYQWTGALAVYSKVGMASEKMIHTGRAYHLALGAFYTGGLDNLQYSIGAEIGNIGQYVYRDVSKQLSPKLSLGGDISMPTTSTQKITLAMDYSAYFATSGYDFSQQYSLGIDYSFYNRYAVRVGGLFGQGNDALSTGFGISYQSFTLNAAARFGLESTIYNSYMLGLSYAI